MAVQTTRSEVTARVLLRVPRDATGDLTGGVRAVLEDVSPVRTARVVDVTDVAPRSTDIHVTAVAGLVFADDPTDAGTAAETLADGFGIVDATVESVDGR